MRQLVIIVEAWSYHCDSCSHAWESICVARHTDDGHCREAVSWQIDGVVGMPPWVTPACPSCFNLRVRLVTARILPGEQVPGQRNGTEAKAKVKAETQPPA
jgi:hypothetical protein